MVYPEKAIAQSLIQHFKANGITQIIISPGSRNAPLTIGFASDPFFCCYSIVDERCAAFFALGMAQQTQKPTAVICTSGSALLNYYPAVAEAFYSQIPLLVISADRPLNKIDIGDGQTIRQQNVFVNHCVFNANLTEKASKENDQKIQQAITNAHTSKGPVHINIPFEEPLYNTLDKISYKADLKPFKEYKKNNIDFSYYVDSTKKSSKILILIGSQNPGIISDENLQKLASANNILVFTECTSNVVHPKFISTIDQFISPLNKEELIALQPDILITFGGMIVSKKIKSYLRTYKPKEHWHVDTSRAYDTYQSLTHHIKSSVDEFLSALPENGITSNYLNWATKINIQRKIAHQNFIDKCPYSDLKVIDTLMNRLPENIHLQISNSAIVRYILLFETTKNTSVFCNRGTSGIDGSTSTALGASLMQNKPTIFITGDISFFYDSNALWNNYIPKNFKIILINNSGGGIFRILPGHRETEVFHKYFETQHHLTAEHLAKMYQLNYYSADTLEKIIKEYNAFINCNDSPSILEIFTPTNKNAEILKEYFNSL